jgi:hypothetical protein
LIKTFLPQKQPNTVGISMTKSVALLLVLVFLTSSCLLGVKAVSASQDSWTTKEPMPTARTDLGTAVVKGKVFPIGGDGGGYFTVFRANEQYTPFGYELVPPAVSVFSPENVTYTSVNVSLAFTVNRPVVWIGFSLDGQDNVTISGNTTLAELTNGLHNITVYAEDSFENMGASETVTFTIAKETETFPIRLAAATAIVIAAVVLVAAVGVGLSAYLKKRK